MDLATIGGGSTHFQAPMSPMTNLDQLASSQLVRSCIRRASSSAFPAYDDPRRRRKSVVGDFRSARYNGPNREGALFCRTGSWMQILDQRTAEEQVQQGRMKRPRLIHGTKRENSPFSVLEFVSIAFGLVSIRGKASQSYLCMDKKGRLYSAPPSNYSSECVFMEEMLENYYNLYSSCAYGGRPNRRWYVALKKTGHPRKGQKSRKRRKSSHFVVVHFDNGRGTTIGVIPDENRHQIAHFRPDGSVQLPVAEHSRFGYGSRDRSWRDRTEWRTFLQTRGHLPVVGRPSLKDILHGSLIKQRLLPSQQKNRVAYYTDKNKTRRTNRLRRWRIRRKERRLARESKRRERRRKRLETLGGTKS